VDTEGTTNVLFPNSYQRADFAPDGAVQGGREVLIPDSLQSGNRAGFYWDYSPPPGTDTVRVFACTDLATAKMIRSRISSLQQPEQNSNPQSRAINDEGIATLHADLSQLATRGIKTVADDSGQDSASVRSDWVATSVNIQVQE
jgi:hypothetical protein